MNSALKNIWIIDDNEIDAFILKALLTKLNLAVDVHHAVHGKEALDWLLNKEKPIPELIFLDLNMPLMDGFSFLKECFAHEFVGNSKIAIISSSSLDSDKDEALMFPDVVDFITKPPSINRLWNFFRLHFPGEKLPTLVDILHEEYPHFSQSSTSSYPYSAPIPENEVERLANLHAYQILDTPREEAFDEIVKLASQICGTPIALVSLIDKGRQWFKAKTGNLPQDETERDIAFCAHTILQDDIFVVEDATKDIRFKENPLVTSNQLRFYAGVPLVSQNGLNIGSLCVIDTVARSLEDSERFALKVLSRQVMNQIELQAKVNELSSQMKEQREARLAEKKAQKDLARSNQVKSNFLSYMSHELRTPIHGLLGISAILQNSVLAEEQKSLLTELESSARSLLTVVNNVLDFSKIEEGEIILEARSFKLARLVESVVWSLKSSLEKKELSLQISMDEALAANLIGDALRLKQILINLLETASQFTTKAEIRFHIDLLNSTPEIQNLSFSLKGIGKGLDAQIPKVLLDSPIPPEYHYNTDKGFDLGMLIAKKLTQAMGGEMGLSAEKDSSAQDEPTSVLWVEIPFKTTTFIPSMEPQTAAVKSEAENAKFQVLVAEDNRVNQLLITRMLNHSGLNIEVDIAQNGKEAIEIYKSKPQQFHLFLTDINMPEMDGLSAAQIMRQQLKAKIPIIAMTANAYDTDKEKYLEVGMNGVLTKPFSQAQLISFLKHYLKLQ